MRKNCGLVSVGYGGRRSSELIGTLKTLGVDLLVDVRLSPRSGVPGFSGFALQKTLAAAGIEYRHEVALGNPPDNRPSYRDGEESAKKRFSQLLETSGQAALAWLADVASKRRVAVLCAERDEVRCHRQQIVAAACHLNPTLIVTSLG